METTAHTLLGRIVAELVDSPESIIIPTDDTDDGATFRVHLHKSDVGKMIGKQGRNANSIRIVLKAIGQKMKRRYDVLVEE